MLAYEDITERLEYAMSVVRHLESVATYPELRAAYNAVQPAVSEFESNILLHEGLWTAIQRYAATAEAKSLTGTKRRFLEKTIDDFKRHGAGLDPAGKARLAEIDVQLSKQTTLFSEHVLDSTNAFELVIAEESKLAGLPESAIAAAKQSAETKVAGWRFTLQGLELSGAHDIPGRSSHPGAGLSRLQRAGDIRRFDNRRSSAGFSSCGAREGPALGFTDFADLVIDDRMAHTGARRNS
jgi:oligopeptidase A